MGFELRIILVVLAVLMSLAAAPAQAAPKADPAIEGMFSAIERAVIEEYYRSHGAVKAYRPGKNKGMPLGLAKRKHLPPGLEKHLERWSRLPPGLEQRTLPDDLLARLGPRHDGAIRRVVGSDVVLIAATGIILDILRGAANDAH